MGDFNLPYINCISHESRAPGSEFIDLINTNSLQQYVNEPTRQNNILDLVMTTPDLRIVEFKAMDKDKVRDHRMIDFALQIHSPNDRTELKTFLNYKRANLYTYIIIYHNKYFHHEK
ncbi:Endonuclease/exonuclease/phosphatase [Trinorchestia longiramus]|nr:Endonuclease/exonuclease/phosphatase [Trinorchestia longiramus]